MFQHLLEGKYQLLSYCQKYWIYHLDECLKLGMEQQREAIEEITSSLSEFLRLRAVKRTRGTLFIIHHGSSIEFLLIKEIEKIYQPLAVRRDRINMLV